jgi:hypothetical protein
MDVDIDVVVHIVGDGDLNVVSTFDRRSVRFLAV